MGITTQFLAGAPAGLFATTFTHGVFDYVAPQTGEVFRCHKIFKQSIFGSKISYVGTHCVATGKCQADLLRPDKNQSGADEAIDSIADANASLTREAANEIASEVQSQLLTAGVVLFVKGVKVAFNGETVIVLWKGAPPKDTGAGEGTLDLPQHADWEKLPSAAKEAKYWARNEAAIREAAERNAVFRDSYLNPDGTLKSTDGFLAKERSLLEELGYYFTNGHWRKGKPDCPCPAPTKGTP